MKLRTKLVLLLSAALVVTMVTSTWLRIRWTRERLERHAKEQASETAVDIASDLEQHMRDDADDDDIAERLKFELQKHRSVANIEFSYDTDEETTSYVLIFTDEEPRIKKTPRPPHKSRPANVTRYETRRAFYDHGESLRPPGERAIEPQWRTADRADSSRWAVLNARPPTPKKPRLPIVVGAVAGQRYLDVPNVPVDPEGPRKGQLTVRVSLASIDALIRTEEVASVAVTGFAVLFLIVVVSVVAQRVVGRPVAELENAMRAVEAGDLGARVNVRGRDEIGALSRGFNEMIGRLSTADGEIRAFNRRLADEVKAATLDLARKNEALGQLNRLLLETRRELGDKERLAALGQLAAQLAHEIGTPLASVSGHLQLAQTGRDVPPALKERLHVANNELLRISKIVRDYLDSTRPVKPARVRCDLGRVVDEAVGIVCGAGRPGLTLERSVADGAGEVETDPGLVRQILVNLIANAQDAIGARGTIAVSVDAADGFTRIAVRDDGSGIAPEDAGRIFEPFYTTKGRGKGTGLGLAICRELAAALGGRITVESAPGAGSTFTVRLPRDDGRQSTVGSRQFGERA